MYTKKKFFYLILKVNKALNIYNKDMCVSVLRW